MISLELYNINELYEYNCFLGASQGQLVLPHSCKDIIDSEIYTVKDELSD